MSAANIDLFGVEISEHDAELLRAAIDRTPVEFKGLKFGCISAFTIRTRSMVRTALKVPYIIQVELMSKNSQSVTIADPKEVNVLKEYAK